MTAALAALLALAVAGGGELRSPADSALWHGRFVLDPAASDDPRDVAARVASRLGRGGARARGRLEDRLDPPREIRLKAAGDTITVLDGDLVRWRVRRDGTVLAAPGRADSGARSAEIAESTIVVRVRGERGERRERLRLLEQGRRLEVEASFDIARLGEPVTYTLVYRRAEE